MKNEDIYIKPQVNLLHKTPLQVAEIAGRTAYDSFNKAEFDCIRTFPLTHKISGTDIPDSPLLNQLAWVHFHHSVLEHVVLQFNIRNISRGVLQELARHRMASLTVRSTRYTMTPIILAYAMSKIDYFNVSKYHLFSNLMSKIPFSVLKNQRLLEEEIFGIYAKLEEYFHDIDVESVLSGAQRDVLDSYELFDETEPEICMEALLQAKSKRNAGDNLKFIVTDNFKTELVWTVNLRSLKNFLDLRNSGSAWFQIRWLAEEIESKIPDNYKELIVKAK